MPVGGYLADRVKAHLPGREMSVAVIASILAAATASLAFGVQDLRVAIVGPWLYSIFCAAGYGVTFAALSMSCRRRLAARALPYC